MIELTTPLRRCWCGAVGEAGTTCAKGHALPSVIVIPDTLTAPHIKLLQLEAPIVVVGSHPANAKEYINRDTHVREEVVRRKALKELARNEKLQILQEKREARIRNREAKKEAKRIATLQHKIRVAERRMLRDARTKARPRKLTVQERLEQERNQYLAKE